MSSPQFKSMEFELYDEQDEQIVDDIISCNKLPSILPAPSLPPLPPLPHNTNHMIYNNGGSSSNNYFNVQNPNHHNFNTNLSIRNQTYNNNISYNNINPFIPKNINNKTYITPNSSYNSLASLNTRLSNTVSTNYTLGNTNNYNNNNNAYDNDQKYDYQYLSSIPSKNINTSSNIRRFEYNPDIKLQIKDYIFISKECTRKLSQHTVSEYWGKDCGLLYKYLDYIFRCQAFKKQIIIINYLKDKYLIFHTALQRQSDHEFLYGLFLPNKKSVVQEWRVQFGNIRNTFLSESEILSKFPELCLYNEYLPSRTIFYDQLSHSSELLLYDDTYDIDINWEERLTTNKDRICQILGNIAFFDQKQKFMKLTSLVETFDLALKKTQKIAALNPRIAVVQGFVDTKHCKYRMELLLPLNIEYPKYSNKYYLFALAITKSNELNTNNKYIAKSILTLDMAYSNARLVGYVDSLWLVQGYINKNKIINKLV